MANYITIKEYAEIHGKPYEAVKSRVRYGIIPAIKIGSSIMVDSSAPWEERKKTGRISNAEKSKVDSCKPKLKIRITKAYYISVEDSSGKEITSDFTFLSKAEAEKLGAKMKREIEARGNQ